MLFAVAQIQAALRRVDFRQIAGRKILAVNLVAWGLKMITCCTYPPRGIRVDKRKRICRLIIITFKIN